MTLCILPILSGATLFDEAMVVWPSRKARSFACKKPGKYTVKTLLLSNTIG